MCGIAGFTTFNRQEDNAKQIITAMCDAIEHRGPDEWDSFIAPEVTFGHRRLSIVGLSDGKQPLALSDGSFTITFNGEIYNYPDLKTQLEAEGVKFQTTTDTEVLLYLFKKYGPEAFKMCNGMFATAIWDHQKKELTLARDRIGKKPLFFHHKDGEIIFASELKAVVKHPKFEKKLSVEGLNKFLTYEYIPSPFTIFEDTWKVEAGEYITIRENNLEKEFFWQHPQQEVMGESIVSEEDAVDQIEKILEDAIRIRLQADVPVGVLLSGGIDSSLVTAMASKLSEQQLKSFSIYFNEASYDESAYIKDIVKEFGLEHHAEYVSSEDMVGLFDKLGGIMDEPMADPSLVPTYFLSKLAASEVKTVLGGDGADELFAGYPTYTANKLINFYNLVPYKLREWVSNLIHNSNGSLLPVSTKNISLDFKLKQFLRGAGVASEVRFFKWMGGFLEKEKRSILSDGVQSKLLGDLPYEDLNRFLSRTNINSELQRLLYLSQKMYLTEDILVKVDRASMQQSLEVRAPFLDYRMIEYATALPERFKLKGFRTKHIQKEVASRHIPDHIINRPKKGFGIPITEWLAGDLKQPMLDLLSKERLDRQGLFDYAGIKTLIDDHLEAKTNNRKLLWQLLSFQLWADEFGI